MKRLLATALLLAAGVSSLSAQQAPFDMSPERPVPSEEVPVAPEAPPQSAPTPPEEGRPPAVVVPPASVPVADIRRRLLPSGSITLAGETAARSWGFNITAAQAASPARLVLGYRNAVVVAPESSRLEVLVNQVPVLQQPIASADGFSQVEVELPPSLLRVGRNDISVRARQRHRTDCTVQSTYELWTEIDAARTWLSFSDPAADTFGGFADLRALAPDAQGRMRVAIVAPGMQQGDIGADLLRLAQAIALNVALPNIDFSISPDPAQVAEGAALRVLLGTVDELSGLTELPASASSGPVAAFLPERFSEAATLLVGGRNRADWLAAIDMILAPVDRPQGGQRDSLSTGQWRLPDAPMNYGSRDMSLAELGIASEQFSGRRYTTSFQFAVPGDFYAGSYGQARFLIDAAYSSWVRPGSLINVYVNGSIASSLPLTSTSGAILSQLPLDVTMRHFRPGLNDVVIEAILLTQQDEACLPGATADDTPRFAFFDTSRFQVPAFARVGQRPNLDAFAGVAYPYGQARDPVALVIERGDASGLSAAANLLSRMAITAGRAIPLDLASSADAARSRDAIFLGAINAIPAGVLAQVGVDEAARSGWSSLPAGTARPASPPSIDIDTWRRNMEGGGGAWLENVQAWFNDTFGITVDMLRFAPTREAGFIPPASTALIIAQGENPAGTGVWTMLTAPDEARLMQGTAALTRQDTWRLVSGHLATLDESYAAVTSEPTTTASYVETVPRSLNNFRLIAANWLSANILSYSLLLVIACVLLGIMTSALLSRLGRGR